MVCHHERKKKKEFHIKVCSQILASSLAQSDLPVSGFLTQPFIFIIFDFPPFRFLDGGAPWRGSHRKWKTVLVLREQLIRKPPTSTCWLHCWTHMQLKPLKLTCPYRLPNTHPHTHTHKTCLCPVNLICLQQWWRTRPLLMRTNLFPPLFCLSVFRGFFIHSLHLLTPSYLPTPLSFCFLPFDIVAISLMPPISRIIDQQAAACLDLSSTCCQKATGQMWRQKVI